MKNMKKKKNCGRRSTADKNNLLFALRERSGLSLASMSELTGVSETSILHAEHGKYVKLWKLVELSKVYGVDVHWLVAGILGLPVPEWVAAQAKVRNLVNEERGGESYGQELSRNMSGDDWITGVEFYRRKRQVTIAALNRAAGLTGDDLKSWRNPGTVLRVHTLSAVYRAAVFLNITVDQMLELHHRSELDDGDRPQRESKYINPANCISNYRVANGLSYNCLAERLHCSRQNAMMICASNRPHRATIEKLAAYEHMTMEEILRLYGNQAA